MLIEREYVSQIASQGVSRCRVGERVCVRNESRGFNAGFARDTAEERYTKLVSRSEDERIDVVQCAAILEDDRRAVEVCDAGLRNDVRPRGRLVSGREGLVRLRNER